MKVRKFKPGDWVKVKGSPDPTKMEVVKYILNDFPMLDKVNDGNYLECVYYRNGERISKIIHENRLLKHWETGGIYKT
ncbi:hypothetical protein HPE56_16505 [Maribacter sp. ANRC-HE7]|uniref:Phage protein n=1 Tax=Maribacter aquimaris TaxID=2737171 RepID=A0ABR7V7X7_9FLAO|nr:hypothetical protein [Maribacter aquimaris]MBD0779402.1 hypothetical protein [Maribacter aquimaris]